MTEQQKTHLKIGDVTITEVKPMLPVEGEPEGFFRLVTELDHDGKTFARWTKLIPEVMREDKPAMEALYAEAIGAVYLDVMREKAG